MTNIEKTNLLCQFYRENSEIASILLRSRGDGLQTFNMSLVGNQFKILEKIWWICIFGNFNTTYLGICNDNTMVKYEYDSTELSFICEGFEHVPFWLQDIENEDCNQEQIEDNNNFLQPYFDKYIAWCNNHGIFPDWKNTKKKHVLF